MTKILCIEDEADYREALVDVLTMQGYEVDEAENGEQGKDKAKGGDHDLIICDINLPKKNGFQILKELQQENDKAVTHPFIFLSAYGQKHDLMKGIDLGANDYFVKPVDFEQLLSTIRSRLKFNNKLLNTISVKERYIRNAIFNSISHDLRTPLNHIIGFSEMIEQQCFGPLEDKYVEYAKLINDAGYQLANQLASTGEAVNVACDEIELEERKTDFDSLIWEACYHLKERLRTEDIPLFVSSDESGVILNIDPRLISKSLVGIIYDILRSKPSNMRVLITSRIDEHGNFEIELTETITETNPERAIESFKNISLGDKEIAKCFSGSQIVNLEFIDRIVNMHNGRTKLFCNDQNRLKAIISLPKSRVF